MSESKFTYNASALGLGGTYLQTNADGGVERVVVPSLASVALSPSGGEGSCIVKGYNRNGVSFSRAESSVVGYRQKADEYVTHSEVRIKNLNLFDRLKIELMHARVVSTHFDRRNQPESKFELVATYENIEMDGKEVVPVLDVDLTENCPTYSHFSAHVGKSLKEYAERFGMKERILENMLKRQDNPALRASLTQDIQVRDKVTKAPIRAERKAYGLKVPDLGHANFAEYQVKAGRRRVTLLRLDLDTLAVRKEGKLFDLAKLIPQLLARKKQRSTAAAGLNLAANGADINLAADADDEIIMAADGGRFGDFSIASVDGNGSPPWKP